MSRIVRPNNTFSNINETVIGGYGELYVHDNAAAQTLTLQNTYYKVVDTVDTWMAGNNSGFTADLSDPKLICNRSGVYQVDVEIDYNGANNDSYKFAVFVNGVLDSSLMAHTDARLASQTISCPISGLVSLQKNDTIDLRVECTSNAGTQIIAVHVNMALNYALAA